MSIESFPMEVLQKIFSYCSHFDYKAFSQVCHRWNDSVEYLLVQRMCLRVSSVSYVQMDDDDYEPGRTKTVLISKSVLLSLRRKYTGIRVELGNGTTDEIGKTLKELLAVCRKRYQVEELWLRGSPNKMLVQLFKGYHNWLQNLTHLDVKLLRSEPRARAGQMVTLPNLERLRWHEGQQYHGGGQFSRRSNSGKIAFALYAPKLSFLSFQMDRWNHSRNLLKSNRQDPDVCHLFLPTLELKTGSQLIHLDLTGASNLNLHYIDGSERIFKNLEQLMFSNCPCDAIVRICDKCPNLKELTIKNELYGDLPLQISPTLSSSLEKLRISSFSTVVHLFLYGPAEFSKLRSIHLAKVKLDTDQRVSLNAPQLTTIDLDTVHFPQSVLTHTSQLRTMSLQVLTRWDEGELYPAPNVTDLSLDMSRCCPEVGTLIDKYFACAPQLTRLELQFPKRISDWMQLNAEELTKTDLTFVEALPRLKHLTICQATLRLTDCTKLAGLKSLVLSHCAIESDPKSNGTVIDLTALEHVRINWVAINNDDDGGIKKDLFPLRVNERQPSIRVVRSSIEGQNIFKSNIFLPF